MGTIIDVSEVLLELGLSASATEEERAIVGAAITRAEGAVIRYLKYDPVRRDRTEYYPQQDFSRRNQASVWESEGDQAILKRLVELSTSELQIQHIPIRSITSLYIDYDGRGDTRSGAFGDETLKVEGTDYWANYDGQDSDGDKLCRDGIIRSMGSWPTTAGTVKIVYSAGYSPEELHGTDSVVNVIPILEAVLDEAVRRAHRALMQKKGVAGFTGPLVSERLGDYAYTVDSTMVGKMYGGQFELMSGSKMALESFVNYGWSMAS